MLRKSRILRNHWTFLSLALLMTLLVCGAGTCFAKDAWPEKQVDLINPFRGRRSRRRPGTKTGRDHLQGFGTAHGSPKCDRCWRSDCLQ